MRDEYFIEHLDSFLTVEEYSTGNASVYLRPRRSVRKLLQFHYKTVDHAKKARDDKFFPLLSEKSDLYQVIQMNKELFLKKQNALWLVADSALESLPRLFNAIANFMPVVNFLMSPFMSVFPSRLDDKQQYKLYDVEAYGLKKSSFKQRSFKSLFEAKEIVSKICEHYEVDCPEVVIKNNPFFTQSSYNPVAKRITMRTKSYGTLLHEAAHHIHRELLIKSGHKNVSTWHGPEFVNILTDVYSHIGGYDRAELISKFEKSELLGPKDFNKEKVFKRHLLPVSKLAA